MGAMPMAYVTFRTTLCKPVIRPNLLFPSVNCRSRKPGDSGLCRISKNQLSLLERRHPVIRSHDCPGCPSGALFFLKTT